MLRNGTTTAAYYATVHLEGSKILADVVHDKGQRALIGKVNMVRNCPDYYKELSVQDSIRDTEEFIRYVRGLQVGGALCHKSEFVEEGTNWRGEGR